MRSLLLVLAFAPPLTFSTGCQKIASVLLKTSAKGSAKVGAAAAGGAAVDDVARIGAKAAAGGTDDVARVGAKAATSEADDVARVGDQALREGEGAAQVGQRAAGEASEGRASEIAETAAESAVDLAGAATEDE